MLFSASGAAQGPLPIIDFQCEDCLSFRIGCPVGDLPPSLTHRQAAAELTEHVRRLRGYALSIGGYHTAIGDWLSAAYWDQAGVFVLHTDRGSTAAKPALDVLIRAMQVGLVPVADAAMLDPHEYQTQDVFLSVCPPPAVTTLAALLGSAHVSHTWRSGDNKVTLAAFLPVARGAQAPAPSPPAALLQATPASPAAPAAASPVSARALGERCTICGDTVRERPLLLSSYVGCACG